MKFYFSVFDKIIIFFEKRAFGVSEWIGTKFGVNPALVRKFFIYLSFVTLGSPLLIYFPMAYFLENKDKLTWPKKRKTVWDFK
jgi:phage shock protein PspC (stress-responsive transcriptional regulator)|tara:strand:+ start:250 stop:498 length:249 start_codon:yes stop_codon:yes gene_type:complete